MKRLTLFRIFCGRTFSPFLFFLFYLSLCLFVFPQAARAHQPHDNIKHVAVSPAFETDGTVFCSLTHINYFILKSTDGGGTWTPSQTGFPHEIVSGIVVSPAYPADRTVFVSTEEGNVFKSIDGGSTWTSSSAGLPGAVVKTLAISPDFAADGTLFAGTMGGGAYKSIDGGASWQWSTPGIQNLYVESLALSPDFGSDQTIFAGTKMGVFKSTDGGGTWFNPTGNAFSFEVTSLAVSPDYGHDRTLFAGVWGLGIFRSRDGGVTWEVKNHGITDLDINAVALCPDYGTQPHVYVATKQGGIFKSVNGGDSFSLMNDGLAPQAAQTDTHYFSFAFSPGYAQDRVVFVGCWEGLHKAVFGATRWRQLDVYNTNLTRHLGISPNFAADGIVFAGTYGGGVYKSTDHGDNWTGMDTGIFNMHVGDVVVSPVFTQDHTVFTGMRVDMLKSLTEGDTWFDLKVNPQDYIYARAISISPEYGQDQTLFMGNGSDGTYPVYRTVDGGNSFLPIAAPFSNPKCFALSPHFATDLTIFAGTMKGVFRSLDAGLTWSRVGLETEDVFTMAASPAFSTDGTIFAGTAGGGVFLSTDKGMTWSRLSIGSLDSLVVESLGLSPDFPTDRTVLAATKSRGVFLSHDGGAAWQCLGLVGKFGRSLEVSPAFPQDGTLFVGSWDGVYRTRDGGATWRRVLEVHRYDDKSQYIYYAKAWSRYHDSLACGYGLSYTDAAGAKAMMIFHGNALTWIGEKAPFGGIARVYIDGVLESQVDLYAPQVQYQRALFTRTGLSTAGAHAITIEVTGMKNPSSMGASVFIDAFDIGY